MAARPWCREARAQSRQTLAAQRAVRRLALAFACTMRARTMAHSIRPRRSALFMPAINVRAVDKARTLSADVIILDLEDAVAPASKLDARDRAVVTVRAGGYGHREVVIRVNGLDSAWGREDIAAVAQAGPDAVLVPKVDSAATVREV